MATHLHFLGAAQTVTGSQYLLETDRAKVVIDCGLFQGLPGIRARNLVPLGYEPATIDAMLLTFERVTDNVSIHNLGTDEYTEVNQSIGWITEHLGLQPTLEYAGGERGWIGDSPFIFLDTSRIRALGWQPKLTIREAVIKTVQYLQGQQWLLERR